MPSRVGLAAEPAYAATMTGAELDTMILNYAILNGALELLPQNLASMAIIPLQMRWSIASDARTASSSTAAT